MPSQADPEVVHLVDAYTRTLERLRARTVNVVESTWTGLGSWRDDDIAAWIAQVVPVVQAGQAQTAAFTDAYLTRTAAVVLDEAPAAGTPRLADFTIEALRGTPAADVYRRPAVDVYRTLKAGGTLTEGVELGRQRAVDLTTTDLQLAKTHSARGALARDHRVVGYRRVLEGSKSCGLCVVASTQRYRKGELMPIHPGCDCGVLPIYGSKDPGQVLDPDRLEAAHQAIADRFGGFDEGARVIDYRTALVTHEHGEIGPVLGVRGQDFTSPSDL